MRTFSFQKAWTIVHTIDGCQVLIAKDCYFHIWYKQIDFAILFAQLSSPAHFLVVVRGLKWMTWKLSFCFGESMCTPSENLWNVGGLPRFLTWLVSTAPVNFCRRFFKTAIKDELPQNFESLKQKIWTKNEISFLIFLKCRQSSRFTALCAHIDWNKRIFFKKTFSLKNKLEIERTLFLFSHNDDYRNGS